jgi:hypothetical protein
VPGWKSKTEDKSNLLWIITDVFHNSSTVYLQESRHAGSVFVSAPQSRFRALWEGADRFAAMKRLDMIDDRHWMAAQWKPVRE